MSIGRFLRTMRHLRSQQVFYRLYYPLKKRLWRPAGKASAAQLARAMALRSNQPFHHDTPDTWIPRSNGFALLNKRRDFGPAVDWSFQGHGLLWAYHLHYFGYLRDEGVEPDETRDLMRDYLHRAGPLRQAPYPTSLRIIHWTAFALRYGIDEEIAKGLFEDALRLAAFPEYHIGANHLLTNGLALFHAAALFGDTRLMHTADRILSKELNAQILKDGGHYERSPGYHAQLMGLLLSCIAIANEPVIGEAVPKHLAALLNAKGSAMAGWLRAMMPPGSKALPVMSDTNQDMAQMVGGLDGLSAAFPDQPAHALTDSGYRIISAGALRLIANVGQPAPAHQPGHSHADPLSFVVFNGSEAIITHHGCANYERGPARDAERATRMHNCITPEDVEQNAAELWAAFRMGRRPHVHITEDIPARSLEATHDGYRKAGFVHYRRWESWGEGIVVTDLLEGTATSAISHLHFHPDHPPKLISPYVVEAGGLRFEFRQYIGVHLQACSHADGFNKIRPAICIQGVAARQSALVISFIHTTCSSTSLPGPGPTS